MRSKKKKTEDMPYPKKKPEPAAIRMTTEIALQS